MVLAMAETLIAERKFVVEASQERLWQLIGRVVFSSFHGVERMEIIDENNWQALLRVKLGFITLNMNLTGEMVDVSPPESLGVNLKARSKVRVLQLNQKITINFTQVDETKTEVTCKAIAEGVGTLFRLFLLGRTRGFAKSTFDIIEERLKYLA